MWTKFPEPWRTTWTAGYKRQLPTKSKYIKLQISYIFTNLGCRMLMHVKWTANDGDNGTTKHNEETDCQPRYQADSSSDHFLFDVSLRQNIDVQALALVLPIHKPPDDFCNSWKLTLGSAW
jgi:hypothetical protein